MARGNQRDKAREAAQKKQAGQKPKNTQTGTQMQHSREAAAAKMREKQAAADARKAAEELARKAADAEKRRLRKPVPKTEELAAAAHVALGPVAGSSEAAANTVPAKEEGEGIAEEDEGKEPEDKEDGEEDGEEEDAGKIEEGVAALAMASEGKGKEKAADEDDADKSDDQ